MGHKLPLLLVVVAFIFYLWLFYPGYMSFDAAFQYWQVRTGEWSSLHPVIMQMHWWVTDFFIQGPGGLFVYYMTLFYLGIYLLISYSGLNTKKQLIVAIVLCLLPYNLMIMPHVWKDIGMWVYALLGLALMMRYKKKKTISNLYLAGLFLWLSILFRVNAMLMLLPIIVYLFYLISNHYKRPKTAILLVPLFVFAHMTSHALIKHLSNTKNETLWPTIAIWDIASVSARADHMLLPEFVTGPGEWLDDIKQINQPWSLTPVVHNTGPVGMWTGLGTPYSESQYKQLANRWIGLPFEYPIHYIMHRLQVSQWLLGLVIKKQEPHELMFVNEIYHYSDNPKLDMNKNELTQNWFEFLKDNKNFWPVNGWPYLLLLIIMLVFRYWQKAPRENQSIIDVCLWTSVISLLSLTVTVPAAESRYLIVFINTVVIAFLLSGLSQPVRKAKKIR